MTVLITGVAGFIGSAVALELLRQDKTVVGIDNLNDYYDVKLKEDRLAQCLPYSKFSFERINIINRQAISQLFLTHHFENVVHLAAQAGVRYSFKNPTIYIDSNLVGFGNVIEAAYQCQVKHFIFSSSSSVYGANKKQPFSEKDSVDHPLSLYAATKRANELIAHCYAYYGLPCTGLRFFTVYGPWSRPDMALIHFTQNILQDCPIHVFNEGNMVRDFTYIDDIVAGVIGLLNHIPSKSGRGEERNPSMSDCAPYRIYNIGNHQPVQLIYYIKMLEKFLNKKAKIEMMPIQTGDIPYTYADVRDLENLIGKLPHTPLEVGMKRFVEWYHAYYRKSALCALSQA
ncbi:MAG TPA: NAD-dependent epimerase/dehydratase family protein [Gammaproteobacteria bacterium]|nr:NAD-dependent epimerase/dehydratase family protein [Gammaproteobacteria bacterium]